MVDNLKQRAVSGALWYGGSRFAIQGLTWGVTILVARILAPEDYGVLGFALLVTGLADMISELGIGAAIIQRQDLDDEDLNAIFWFSLSVSLLVYLLVWLAAPWLSAFFKQPELVNVLRVLMLTFIINSLRIIPWNLLAKEVAFKPRSVVEVAANIIGAFSTLGMAYKAFGVWALVWGILIRQITLTIGCQILLPWWPKYRFAWCRLRKVLGFGLNVSAGRVVWYAYSNADFLVVGRMLGQQSLGLYTMVWQLAMLPVDRISAIVNQVAYPVYAELQHDPERLTRYFLEIVKMVSLVTVPVLAGVFLVADIAVPLVLTAKWQGIISPLRIMALVGIVSSVGVLIGPAVVAKGRADLALKYNCVCVLVMPASFIIGAQSGLMGVAWAWLLCHPILVAVWFITTHKLLGYKRHDLFLALKPAVTCTVCMMSVVAAVRIITNAVCSGAPQLIILIVAGGVGYMLTLKFLFQAEMGTLTGLFALKARLRE